MTPDPGWYDNPDKGPGDPELRYWDGAAWTTRLGNRVEPSPGPSWSISSPPLDPEPSPPAPSPADSSWTIASPTFDPEPSPLAPSPPAPDSSWTISSPPLDPPPPAPAEARAASPRPNRRRVVIVGVVVLIALIVGLGASMIGDPSTKSPGIPVGQTIHGTMTLSGQAASVVTGGSCTGGAKFADVKAGATVTVTDNSQSLVGRTILGGGSYDATSGVCSFLFSVVNVPKRSSYNVQVAQRGVVIFTYADMVADSFAIVVGLQSTE